MLHRAFVGMIMGLSTENKTHNTKNKSTSKHIYVYIYIHIYIYIYIFIHIYTHSRLIFLATTLRYNEHKSTKCDGTVSPRLGVRFDSSPDPGEAQNTEFV